MLGALAAAAGTDDPTHGGMRAALESVRRHLGMEVGYVSEFVGGRAVFREVDAPGLDGLIKAGDPHSLDDVCCNHILDGRAPELMPDTADVALARSMPITGAVPIGAHVSVPIRLPDGRTCSMFCCLSPHANPSLNQRDLQVMRVFADLAAHQISQGIEAERAVRTTRAEVERVLDEDRFRIVYQPIFTLRPFRVAGFEALCRFAPEPYRPPDAWFNQAAGAGCGVRLELAVLRKALGAFAALPDEVFVSVNASPQAITGGGLGAVLAGLRMDRLVLEITEHAEVGDYDALRGALAPLRRAGARLAIDDAGAGYSSLRHILQLGPDIIKLDMGLTRSIDRDSARRAMASALTCFARETDCQIVAEGIENDLELAALKALGVAKGQGYVLGRPMELRDAEALVRTAPAGRPA